MEAIMHLINENLLVFIIGLFATVFILSRLPRLVDPIVALIAFVMFAAFISVIVLKLGSVDLGIIVVGTLVLAAFDFVQTLRGAGPKGGV